MKIQRILLSLCSLVAVALPMLAQPEFPPGPGGPPPFGGGGGPMGGPRGPQPKLKLVEQFDKDGDKILNADERKAALDYLEKKGAGGIISRQTELP